MESLSLLKYVQALIGGKTPERQNSVWEVFKNDIKEI